MISPSAKWPESTQASILVIGSTIERNQKELGQFCIEVGTRLRAAGHRILICSAREDSADLHLLRGFLTAGGLLSREDVRVYHPDDSKISRDWDDLENKNSVNFNRSSHRGPEVRNKNGDILPEGIKLAFLLCQLRALEDADLVLAVGGNTIGASSLLLPMAASRGTRVLPFRFLDGAAEQAFRNLEGDLRRDLGDKLVERLRSSQTGADTVIEALSAFAGHHRQVPARVFLSYSWKRPEWADRVEALLRRESGLSVFRDEQDLVQGERIEERIKDEIEQRCGLFIALWSREYVASPYCHDELEMWVKAHGRENLYLLRMDDTRPVWLSVRKSTGNRDVFFGNWPTIGSGRAELETALRELFDRYSETAGRTL
jgi:hypothetical protein